MPIIINFPDRPKWFSYYWSCAKHFGEGCYRTWLEELSFALVVMFIAYLISRGPDTRAANDLQVALISSGIGLGIFALWHLIRAPFLAHADAVVGDPRAAVPSWYGVFGVIVLLGLIVGGGALGRYIYLALPKATVEIIVKAPPAPITVPVVDLEKQKRAEIRMALGKLLRNNNSIRAKCLEDNHFPCAREKDSWIKEVETYLAGNMEASYLLRFDSATPAS